ncbi:histone H3-K27 trimethylation [Branchiostoma belcheri]|nr:histone H3-K27 trimethylation [Branchiostoma belcheri]
MSDISRLKGRWPAVSVRRQHRPPRRLASPRRRAKAPRAHPPTTAMITAAVEALKDRTGSSVPAIKKYIAANYKFDVEKKAHFIKRALKALVEKGTLLQVKKTKKPAAKKTKKSPAKKPAAKNRPRRLRQRRPSRRPRPPRSVQAQEEVKTRRLISFKPRPFSGPPTSLRKNYV